MSLQQFRKHALPSTISEENVKAVLDSIDLDAMKEAIRVERNKPLPRGDSNKTHGTEVTKGRSKSGEKIETEFFKHIITIYNRVASVGRQVLKRQEISLLDYSPDRAPISSESQNTFIPHCNLVLAASTSCKDDANDVNVYYCDVFVTCEFKKGKSSNDVYGVRIS
jgi:hypothetical protein